jgi:hypothetical protein
LLNKGLRVLPALAGLLGLLLSPAGVLASGIGVTPGRLSLEAYPLVKASESIVVVNTSDEEGLCQVYVEGEVSEWFIISPAEFLLGAGDSQVVEITVSPPLASGGEYQVEVCVVSLVSASELRVGCGVRVPLQVSVGRAPPVGKIAELMARSSFRWLIIGVVAAIVIPVAMRRRRRSREA